MKTTGIVILVLGLLVTFYTGFTFITNEKVIDIGTVEIRKEKENHLSWPPILGVVVIVVGGAMYLYGSKKGD